MDIDKIRVVNDPTVKWISQNWGNKKELGADFVQFGFLGIPFDYAVSHRPGTRFGPQSILDVLNSYSLYCTDKRVSLQNTVFHDLGLVDIVHDLRQSYKNMENAVVQIPKEYIPIFLGGDHSITDPIIRGMQQRSAQNFGLIMFDTHFDFREPLTGKEHSGHWLRTLEDVIDYRNVAMIGIGAPIYSEYYMAELEKRGAKIWTVYELRKYGRESVIQEAINHVLKHTKGAYLSIDIDCIDQAFAPGCSVPNPNGLFAYEVMDSVFEICSSIPVVGMDINEVSPWYDPQENFTSHIAANIVMNFMAGVVKREIWQGMESAAVL
ncbi:agmatinase family protein [Effusibacillus consociatus]|uniref:Agmatinase family protein n=1 Tax=Effusibacillus consociatus TaxID=1117041 RepID=A0ABV9Q9L2_9BACL